VFLQLPKIALIALYSSSLTNGDKESSFSIASSIVNLPFLNKIAINTAGVIYGILKKRNLFINLLSSLQIAS